jgi:acyl carrier protein
MNETKSRIREFIIENFLFDTASDLRDDTSFLEEGIIDSTGILELVTFLEESFSIQLADHELIPENLDSINRITTFLSRRTSSDD